MSVVVLISGRGSNLQALLEAGLPVAAVISNVAGAGGLAIADRRGVPTFVVPHKDYDTRESFDAALAAAIDRQAGGSDNAFAHGDAHRAAHEGEIEHRRHDRLAAHHALEDHVGPGQHLALLVDLQRDADDPCARDEHLLWRAAEGSRGLFGHLPRVLEAERARARIRAAAVHDDGPGDAVGVVQVTARYDHRGSLGEVRREERRRGHWRICGQYRQIEGRGRGLDAAVHARGRETSRRRHAALAWRDRDVPWLCHAFTSCACSTEENA